MFQWLVSRIIFVLGRLPVLFFREPHWIKKFFAIATNENIYRALQAAYDYFGNPYCYRQDFFYRNFLKQTSSQSAPVPLNLKYQPLISLIVPVYYQEPQDLQLMIDSVLKQSYGRWQLCLANGGSSPPSRELLDWYQRRDPRIQVKHLARNYGIAGNSNQALMMARGEYLGLLDADDELSPGALDEVVLALNIDDYDLVYSDHEVVERYGVSDRIFFKPDWSPDYLLSTNYLAHLVVFKKKLLDLAGNFNPALEEAQDYDLLLRLTEKTQKIYHIPKVLYRWRKTRTSAASNFNNKPRAAEAGRRALELALERRGTEATVEYTQRPGIYRVRRRVDHDSLVSIIIPFKNQVMMLKKCLQSVFQQSSYKNFEIILVDNGSTDRNIFDYLYQLKKIRTNLKFISYNREFNFSKINNLAAEFADGQFLLFLNSDTEVLEPTWIEAMLEHAQRPEVGAVGAKLVYPNGNIQHCGVVLDRRWLARHINLNLPDWPNLDYIGRTQCVNNYSAVTAACMMVVKKKFQDLGGFDEALPVSYNDVDFCLRLSRQGYINVYTPHALLQHRGSATRARLIRDPESLAGVKEYFKNRWGNDLEHDPYFPYSF